MVELTDEDREALRFARDVLLDPHADREPEEFERAVNVLGRLLAIAPLKWRVSHFDRGRCSGVVECDDGRIIRFHSTSFQSDTSQRWPRVGEEVEVAFNARGALLSVHGK